MTLGQLRTFAAVAESGAIQGAARRLHVTQPAVSAAVRALEGSLGVDLVEPEGRGIRLTAAGTTFATYARRVLGLLDEARVAVRGEDDPTRGLLRIAAVTTVSEHVLPSILAAFRHAYPQVGVMLEVGNKEQVWTWLADHAVDVTLAGRPPASHPALRVRARRYNEHVVVASPGTVPTDGDHRPLTALEGHTWLLREEGSGTRATLEATLAAAEMTPRFLTLGSNGAVVAGAAAGLGVTMLSRDAVGRELDAGELAVVETDATPLVRPWHVATHLQAPPTTRLFVRHLLDVAATREAPRFELADEPAVVG